MLQLALFNTEIYHHYKLTPQCTVNRNSEITSYLSSLGSREESATRNGSRISKLFLYFIFITLIVKKATWNSYVDGNGRRILRAISASSGY